MMVTSPIVIFDLDGTLVDSARQISDAMKVAPRGLGLGELPEKFIAEQLGKPIGELIPDKDLEKDVIEKLILDFAIHFRSTSSPKMRSVLVRLSSLIA